MDSIERVETTTEVTSLWEDYQNGLSYQQSSGLAKNLPKFVKFYEGDQWAAPTKNTKNLPRPVVNIIKMICRNKKSAILSVPVKIIYRAEDDMADVEKFNRFADYIQKELGQEHPAPYFPRLARNPAPFRQPACLRRGQHEHH